MEHAIVGFVVIGLARDSILVDAVGTFGVDWNVGLANALARSLGGCTLKESVELARLTMAGTASLTPDGVMATRKEYFQPSRGFTQLDTRQAYYEPSPALQEWIEDEAGYFLTGQDSRLRARGLLFDGHPGTGKTPGAKWIAHKLGVPLFRLDFAATKNKYVGESENNLLMALARLDNEEICVVLMDGISAGWSTSSDGTERQK